MIFISAGHHMAAKGATHGIYNEHDEVKIWQSLIVNHLGSLSMSVPDGVLKEKTTFINSWSVSKLDIAVDLHLNSGPRGSNLKGSETLYYPESKRGKAIAEILQKSISEIFLPDRGAKEGYYRMNPTYGVDWFLRKTKCTSIIIEPEFITNIKAIQEKRDEACQKIANTLQCIQFGDL